MDIVAAVIYRTSAMVSWLDTFVATPTIGFLVKGSWNVVLQPTSFLGAFFDRHEVVRLQRRGPGGETFVMADGHTLSFEGRNVAVQFAYPPPELEPHALSWRSPMPQEAFTVLTRRTLGVTADLCKTIEATGARVEVERVGLVAQCGVRSDQLPPGIAALLKHFAKPWPLGLLAADGSWCASIATHSDYSDRCHHRFEFDSKPRSSISADLSKPVTLLSFDYQRFFSKPVQLSSKKVTKILEELVIAAEEYYERLGEGLDV